MKTYLTFLEHILRTGTQRHNRTDTDTISTFGYMMRFPLAHGFPALTTKKLFWKGVVAELLWFLRGETNISTLNDAGVHIWDEWADPNGELGPVYGKQWRSWPTSNGETVDQIARVVDDIRHHPTSRRLIVSAWNVGELHKMALPPCHLLFQFYVSDDHKLSCMLTQRSADAFLGVPFNIASYSLLTHLIAHQCDLGVGDFVWSGGDCHIYVNHQEQVKAQLQRTPMDPPQLVLHRKPSSLFEYTLEDIGLVGYLHHGTLPAPIAV